MTRFKLLVVEDHKGDIDACKNTKDIYEAENACELDIKYCESVEKASEMLDGSFDGAIIDLKLGDKGNEGMDIVNFIEGSFFSNPGNYIYWHPRLYRRRFEDYRGGKKGRKGVQIHI